MNLARILLLALLFGGALFAYSTMCGAGPSGGPLSAVPCSSLTDIQGLPGDSTIGSLTISGNTVTGDSGIRTLEGFGPYTRDENAVVSFDDTIAIPKSPAGDVFKIVAEGGFLNSIGTNASGQMTAGSYSYQTVFTHCYFGSCIDRTTVSADNVSSLTVQGELSIFVWPYYNGLPNYGDVALGYSENITLERFKADGVTPDVFTPEPSSSGLALLGFMALGVVGFVPMRRARPV